MTAHRSQNQLKSRVIDRAYRGYSTVSTFMKFVFPGTCRGAPPVMTRCCPDSINPERRAASIEQWIMSSMVAVNGMETGTTPQHSDRKSSAVWFGVGARIGCFGRKRDTRRAVEPDHVGVMIAAAPISFAMK